MSQCRQRPRGPRQTLLAVAGRQRHVDARQAQGLHLSHGPRARTTLTRDPGDGQRILHRQVDHVPAVRQSGSLNSCANGSSLPVRCTTCAPSGSVRRTCHRLVDAGPQGACSPAAWAPRRRDAWLPPGAPWAAPCASAYGRASLAIAARRGRPVTIVSRCAFSGRGGEGQSDDLRVARTHLVRQAGARVLARE